nr:retrovirus-related Pol polyprotein from transposon TNT 1-94 [Tanacetum cinerariifolium]
DLNVNNTNNLNTVSPTDNAAGIKDNAVDENIVYGRANNPKIPDLEEIGRFGDAEDDDSGVDMNNLDIYFQVSPVPTTRIHKDHSLEQVIEDLYSAPQTRRMSKNLEGHGLVSTINQRTNHKDLQNYFFACFLSQMEPKKKLIEDMLLLEKTPKEGKSQEKGGLTFLFAKATSDKSKLWHRRLGHLNFKTINKPIKGNLVRCLPSKLFKNDQNCVACQKGKQHRASCKTKTENSISLPLHLLHMDLFGPTFVKSLMKKMYCIVVTNDYSRFTWVLFLATKDETSSILKSFITRIKNLLDHKVKVIRCDNGTEFLNREMNQFCEMNGIIRQFSVARTPQQNGVTEIRNMTIIEASRTMLADSKLPTTFWIEVVNTACYVQNRVLVVKPHNKTSYKLFHGRIPTLSFMKPFGCPITILNTKDHLGKFNGKADEGSEPDWLFDIDALTRTMNYESVVTSTQSNGFADPNGNKVDEDPGKRIECNDQDKEMNVNNTNNVNTVSSTVNVAGTNEDNELPFDPNMPALEDVGTFNFLNEDEDDDAMADMNNLDTTIQVSPTLTIRIHKDHPLNQLIGDLHSVTQTRNMIKNLEEHGAIGTKWVFKNKKDKRGIMIRNKARLVAQGHTQEEWIDYDEVFAPVARIKAVRLFLAYASFKDFVVYKIDVKSSFFYGKIEEEVYVCQPPGFKDPDFPGRVYKLEKSLYGLHQAPRACQDKYVAEMLKKFGFTKVKNANTPIETQEPLLKDEDGEKVKVHMYRSMIGSLMYLISSRPDIMFAVCACARYQVNLKVSHLHTVKRIFRVDGKEIIITESYVRRDLQLADEDGVDCLPNSTIFENFELMGFFGGTIPSGKPLGKPSSLSGLLILISFHDM